MITGTGGGSSTQLSIELFKIITGTWIVLVPYKGMQKAIKDVIAGQVHFVCETAASILRTFAQEACVRLAAPLSG